MPTFPEARSFREGFRWRLVQGKTLPDGFFVPYLEQIGREIHGRPNRTRYAMNNALIAIGIRNHALEAQAAAVAAQIGVVEVDHGETNCQTPTR